MSLFWEFFCWKSEKQKTNRRRKGAAPLVFWHSESEEDRGKWKWKILLIFNENGKLIKSPFQRKTVLYFGMTIFMSIILHLVLLPTFPFHIIGLNECFRFSYTHKTQFIESAAPQHTHTQYRNAIHWTGSPKWLAINEMNSFNHSIIHSSMFTQFE